MTRPFLVWDESGTRIRIEADGPDEAAQEYVDTGDWPDEGRTRFHSLFVEDEDGELTTHTVTVPPDEPSCTEDDHTWRETGLQGNGAGVLVTETCKTCGLRMVTDTWATNPSNGTQGHTTVIYTNEEE